MMAYQGSFLEDPSVKPVSHAAAVALFMLAALLAGPARADDQAEIEDHLAAFVTDMQARPPSAADLTERVRHYLEKCPGACYGATVTLLNDARKAVASPYWYRRTGWRSIRFQGKLEYADLMSPDYRIDEQRWLQAPLQAEAAVWSEPYFDAGGGETWMRTLSVPVTVGDRIIAVATTDLKVPAPAGSP